MKGEKNNWNVIEASLETRALPFFFMAAYLARMIEWIKDEHRDQRAIYVLYNASKNNVSV